MGSLAWGQSNPKILLNADDDGFIKGTIPDFSYEGKVNLYTIKGFDHAYYGTPIEGQTVDITFLDRQFEAEKTLQIPIELNNVYMHKGERRGFIYHREDDSSLCSYTDDEGNTVDVFTVETAKSYLGYNEDDDWSMETKGNGTYFYSRWTYFFDYEIYGINGTQYPQRSFYWLDEKGHLYNVFYRSYGVHYTGEWVDYESDFRGKSTSTIYWLYYIDYDSGVFSLDYDNCTVTQTLFNNDEKYEYVVPFADGSLSSMWTKDRDGDGEVDSYEKYYGEATAGFHIMSEDGTILNTVTYDGGFEGKSLEQLDVYWNKAKKSEK